MDQFAVTMDSDGSRFGHDATALRHGSQRGCPFFQLLQHRRGQVNIIAGDVFGDGGEIGMRALSPFDVRLFSLDHSFASGMTVAFSMMK